MGNEAKKIENCKAEIKLTVKWEDIEKTYNAELAKYQKQVALPGFRKGKVPVSVLETKFGSDILNDVCFGEMNNAMTKAFEEVDSDLRPLPYARPEILEYEKLLPFRKNEDINFTVQYETMPEINLTEYKKLDVEYPNVKISDEMVNTEIERYRDQNAIVKKKESGIIEEGDIVTVDYVNLDSSEENAKVDNYTFTVGKKQGYYKFDDQVVGMKDGETKEFTMSYKEEEKPSGLDKDSVKMKVSVKAVKVRELPNVDDEFAQDVKSEYKTVDDMKNGIRKKLEEDLDNRMKETKIKLITGKILEKTDFSVPKTMVDFEIENAFRRMASQYGTTSEQFAKYLQAIGQTKESFTASWRADAEQNLKSQLVINKVETLESIKADEEKVKAILDKQVPADAKEEDRKRFEETVRDNLTFEATIDFLIKENNLKPGKVEITYEDFASGAYLKKDEKEQDGKTGEKPAEKKTATKKESKTGDGEVKKTVRKTAAKKETAKKEGE